MEYTSMLNLIQAEKYSKTYFFICLKRFFALKPIRNVNFVFTINASYG